VVPAARMGPRVMSRPAPVMAIAVSVVPGSSLQAPLALVSIRRRGATLLRLGVTPTDPSASWIAKFPAQDLILEQADELEAVLDTDDPDLVLRVLAIDRDGQTTALPHSRRAYASDGLCAVPA
jgi:hypothetical protein